jgi:ABC-type glycerol-3-phosphate transport system substrate-binding protein
MKTSPFQIGIIIFSIVIIIIGVLIFSGVVPVGNKSSDSGKLTGNFTIWGTFPAEGLRSFFDTLGVANSGLKVNYITKDPSTFPLELSEAIANDKGPDLILFTQEDIIQNQGKLALVPYDSYPERTFRDTYIEEASLFLLPDGIIGFPIAVDPMVMYYNKSLLENAGYSVPPKTWDVLLGITPSLTKKKSDLTIVQSAVPFGAYTNLNNAKDVLSMLFIQAGDPIVAKQAEGFSAILGFDTGAEVPPAQSALEFFTQFSNPLSKAYTWNRAQIAARDDFLNESLVFYPGYASELPSIADKNPNLNFDMMKMPQIPTAKVNATFGKMYALGIVKAGKKPDASFALASMLSTKESIATLTDVLSEIAPIAPARRDLIGTPPQTSYGPIIYASGLMARGWYDPGDYYTNPVFYTLVEDVIQGALTPIEALLKARSALQLTL